jgi:hypothetical protein
MAVAVPKKKKKVKKITVSKAQEAFNASIRRRDGRCVTCGTTQNLQASHVFAVGGNGGLRFHPKNVHAQCAKCHLEWHNRNHVPYHNYCSDFLDELYALRSMTVKYNVETLKAIYNLANNDMLEAIEQLILASRLKE